MKLSRRLIILLVTAGVLLTVLITVGVYGLIIGPAQTTEGPGRSPESSSERGERPNGERLPLQVPEERDPVRFARAVSMTLFTWDTTLVVGPETIADAVLQVADPSGYETPGLYNDLHNYLPTLDQWAQLREYDTGQDFEITRAVIPDEWNEIAETAAADLPEGAVAVTIDGTRIRYGSWDDEAVERMHKTSFTMFLACPEEADSCHVLRLSELGNALR